MNLDSIRKEYQLAGLLEKDVKNNPFQQFEIWINNALSSEVQYPTAMSLITIGTDNFPQSRTVLLKDFSDEGFTFFTNYNSEKGLAIEKNAAVGIHFFWPELERQVRISGVAQKTSALISDNYFFSRPVESQVAAIISKQSTEINSRKELQKPFNDFIKNNKDIVRPDNWGGYLVKPVQVEFWQGRENRLHDRILFIKQNNKWIFKRLAP